MKDLTSVSAKIIGKGIAISPEFAAREYLSSDKVISNQNSAIGLIGHLLIESPTLLNLAKQSKSEASKLIIDRSRLDLREYELERKLVEYARSLDQEIKGLLEGLIGSFFEESGKDNGCIRTINEHFRRARGYTAETQVSINKLHGSPDLIFENRRGFHFVDLKRRYSQGYFEQSFWQAKTYLLMLRDLHPHAFISGEILHWVDFKKPIRIGLSPEDSSRILNTRDQILEFYKTEPDAPKESNKVIQ